MRLPCCIAVLTILAALTRVGAEAQSGSGSYRDAGLSDAQWRQLKDLDVTVILPTALPAGFRAVSVQVKEWPSGGGNPKNHRHTYIVTYSNGSQTFTFGGSPLGQAGNDPDPSMYFRRKSPVLGVPALNTGDGVCYGSLPVAAVSPYTTLVNWGSGIVEPYYYDIRGCDVTTSASEKSTALDAHTVGSLWSSTRVIGRATPASDMKATEAAAMQDLVREFYRAWGARNFQFAYSMLSDAYKAAHPYADWLKSHATIEHIEVQTHATSDPLVTAIVVHSTDRIDGKVVKSSFTGSWRGKFTGHELKLDQPVIHGAEQ